MQSRNPLAWRWRRNFLRLYIFNEFSTKSKHNLLSRQPEQKHDRYSKVFRFNASLETRADGPPAVPTHTHVTFPDFKRTHFMNALPVLGKHRVPDARHAKRHPRGQIQHTGALNNAQKNSKPASISTQIHLHSPYLGFSNNTHLLRREWTGRMESQRILHEADVKMTHSDRRGERSHLSRQQKCTQRDLWAN